MSCNNNSTTLISILPVPGTTTTYTISLEKKLCCGLKACINSATPPTAILAYNVVSIENVGNGAYSATLAVSGSVVYMPYGCCCPKSDPILFNIAGIPLTAATVPTITAGKAVVSYNTPICCSNLTNAVTIESSINVAVPTAGTSES